MPIPEITVDQVAERLNSGAALFDVRQPHEYEEAHAPGAVLVPLGDVPERIGEFPVDREVLVICRSGGRSMQACEFLHTQGIRAVNIAGGTLDWIAAGFDVATGDSPG